MGVHKCGLAAIGLASSAALRRAEQVRESKE